MGSFGGVFLLLLLRYADRWASCTYGTSPEPMLLTLAGTLRYVGMSP